MEQIIQQWSMDEKNNECLESDNKKENNFLHFHMAMVRDMSLDEKGEDPQKLKESEYSTGGTEGSTEGNTEGECSVDEVLSRSENYGMTWCTYTKQCEITSVSIIKQEERRQVVIQSLGQTIIHPEIFQSRRRKACMDVSKSDEMTIHYYKSDIKDRKGRPVVLNFSDTNRFLKCIYKNDKAVLTVECWDQDGLKFICKNDKNAWPFVFFLSTMKDNLCRFESAACSGWFIHTGSDLVYACTRLDENVQENTFRIIAL
ncbi:hypothetical protein PHYPO_G00147760 [Pangasianodon hypophthalmus]|uniref:Interleukin-1 n=1 Tax=Pangasianodon hypophthalmus TaxID=310915 RepID=A0A5N5K6P9_PANHP|nr:hypothetical protein PHYPO_G00147760 [Pangasianodon hypophthalmus]